jgi:hypothetical protein
MKGLERKTLGESMVEVAPEAAKEFLDGGLMRE